MRRRFNNGGYWDRLKTGQLTEKRIRQSPNVKFKELKKRYPNIHSVTARWRDCSGLELVEVHYYAHNLDGEIIPNKRPDPKLLFEDGVLYHLKPPMQKRIRKAVNRLWSRALVHMQRWRNLQKRIHHRVFWLMS